jgi:hypothetical protein
MQHTNKSTTAKPYRMRRAAYVVAGVAVILVLAIPVGIWYRARTLRREIEGAVPRIGIIDFYGMRKVTEQQVRARLPVREGDVAPFELDPAPLNPVMKLVWRLTGQSEVDKSAVVASLQSIPGVVRADVTFVQGGSDPKATLFVGVAETGAPQFTYRAVPNGTVALPSSMIDAYGQLMEALPGAMAKGVQEDDSQGYALHSDATMRAIEEKMIAFAANHVALVRDVLKNAGDANQRIAAAWIIGYAPDKRVVLNDLLDAARDPDETVRNNAVRALGIIAEFAAQKPELGIRLDPSLFVDMLNSVIWTDRNKATMVLYGLTETRPADTLQMLHERAMPALLEMARWKDDHAWDALELLGRIGGMDDKEIEASRDQNDRERVIAAATAAAHSSAPAPHKP